MESGDFKVVKAEISDIAELTALLQLLFEQEEEFTPEPYLQRRGLNLIVSDPSIGVIFLVKKNSDDEVAAMVSLLFTISTALGGRAAVLEDMIVSPSYQRKGLGSMLIDEAVRFSQNNGIHRISLLTDSENKSAASFYTKNGFEKSSMTVFRKLLRKKLP